MKSIKIEARSKEFDSTFQLISWWKKEQVRNAKVLVVGAGALGNEVLKNLALLNVGQIIIVDFDTIEYSNLSRSVLFRESDIGKLKGEVAAAAIKKINPNVKVKVIKGDITIDVGLGLIKRMDVVIGCLDNRLARLFLNRACHRVNKTWVDAAIENLSGQLYVFKPGQSCYECTLTSRDWQLIKYRLGCADVAKRNHSFGRVPTTPISSSILGAMQVQEALKVINGNNKELMVNQHLYYEGMNNLILQLENKKLKEDCQSHFEYDPIIALPISVNMQVSEALSFLAEHFKDDEVSIELDKELILEIAGKESLEVSQIVIPKPHFTEAIMKQYRRIDNEDIIILKEVNHLDRNFEFQDLTLEKTGIPPLHIVKVFANGNMNYVEFCGDESFLNFM